MAVELEERYLDPLTWCGEIKQNSLNAATTKGWEKNGVFCFSVFRNEFCVRFQLRMWSSSNGRSSEPPSRGATPAYISSRRTTSTPPLPARYSRVLPLPMAMAKLGRTDHKIARPVKLIPDPHRLLKRLLVSKGDKRPPTIGWRPPSRPLR